MTRPKNPDRKQMTAARHEILDVVNAWLAHRGGWSMRRLQSAVCIARRRGLVSHKTLTAAGFRVRGRRR